MSRVTSPWWRASAVLRLYPPAWRDRYGAEFHQLLLDELDQGRPAPWWWINLVGHAFWARLTERGLAGEVEPARRIDAAVQVAGAALVVGALCGAAIWAQLAVGWQWSAPASAPTRSGLELITGGLVGLGLTGVLCAAGSLTMAVRRNRLSRSGPRVALAVFCVGTVVLVLGAGWIGLSWPGTGGHAWAGRDMVPAWMGRRAWALTLSLSSYWAHPRKLAALGTLQVGWMAMSPLLIGLVACAWRRAVGPVRLGRRLPRLATLGLVVLISVSMWLIAMGAGTWDLGGPSGPHGLFVPGTIDLGLLGITGFLTVVCALLARRIALAPRMLATP